MLGWCPLRIPRHNPLSFRGEANVAFPGESGAADSPQITQDNYIFEFPGTAHLAFRGEANIAFPGESGAADLPYVFEVT